MYSIYNSETKEVSIIKNDADLIEFANKEQTFYDSHDFILFTLSQCKSYIKKWCDNLTILNDMNKSEILARLNSQVTEELSYLHLNELDEDDPEKHFLFNLGRALIWVIQEDGIVTSVLDSKEMGYDDWLYVEDTEKLIPNSFVKEQIHIGEVRIFNSVENIALFNELVKLV